jgi:hypothetical protein
MVQSKETMDAAYVSARHRTIMELRPHVTVNIFDTDDLVSEDSYPRASKCFNKLLMVGTGLLLLLGVVFAVYFYIRLFAK